MPRERKYQEEEIAAIFDAAARPGQGALAPADGLTLAELQAIGSEVGLEPARIARAAAALDARGEVTRRTELGLPVAVGRTIDLPRAPDDREWEMLVAELRQTFNARGRVGSRGDVREWTNGNLHAFVEPTADGHRLRLGTTKGDAAPLNRAGGAGLALGLVAFVLLSIAGGLPDAIVLPMMLALMGAVALGANVVRLPGWARQREAQMEHIAARARELLAAPALEGGPPAGALPANTAARIDEIG